MKINFKHGAWAALIVVMGTGLTLAIMPGKPHPQKDSCCQGKEHSDSKGAPCPMHAKGPAGTEETQQVSESQSNKGPALTEAMLTGGKASDCPFLEASSPSSSHKSKGQ